MDNLSTLTSKTHARAALSLLNGMCDPAKAFLRFLVRNNKDVTLQNVYDDCQEPMWVLWVAIACNVPAPFLLDVCENLGAHWSCWEVSNFNLGKSEAIYYYYVASNHDYWEGGKDLEDNWDYKHRMMTKVKRVITLELLIDCAKKNGVNGWYAGIRPNDELPF